jgi:hypothetical protein
MSRAGMANDTHCPRPGVANHGSGAPGASLKAADDLAVRLLNPYKHRQFASNWARVTGADLDLEGLNADRVWRTTAPGRGCTGFELTHLMGPDEATPTL